jgi:hypothetical protein
MDAAASRGDPEKEGAATISPSSTRNRQLLAIRPGEARSLAERGVDIICAAQM